MGKDFTSAKGDDNVYTPYSFTEQLLEHEKFDYDKTFAEPCCGNGAIVKILKKTISKLITSDKFHHDPYERVDFLNNDEWNVKTDYIITNPPYSKLNEFIVKAKQVATEKFAFLCKITHLGGVDRFESKIFRDPEYPLTKIYMFTRQANLRFFNKEKAIYELDCLDKIHRYSKFEYDRRFEKNDKQMDYPCLRDDGKYPAGMYYYCWLIWEKQDNIFIQNDIYNGWYNPEFHWIDNNKYILRSKD